MHVWQFHQRQHTPQSESHMFAIRMDFGLRGVTITNGGRGGLQKLASRYSSLFFNIEIYIMK